MGRNEVSLIAKEVRINEWSKQINDCQNRPKGMDVQTWCQQNNIKKADYYYRMRKVREYYLELSTGEDIPSFLELNAPIETYDKYHIEDESTSTAGVINIGNIKIELSNSATPEFLKNLIGALTLC